VGLQDRLQFGNDDLAKYSFLPQAGDYIRAQGISVSELGNPEFNPVLKRAEERVLEAIRYAKVSGKIDENREVEIMSFPVSLMLVRATKLDHLMSRYALAEAMRVESFLEHEGNKRIVEDIFRGVLGIQLEHSNLANVPNFRIPLAEYVRRAKGFHKPEWKIINRSVQDGKVYLSQHDLIRLIREEIQSLILERLKGVNVPKLPEAIDSKVKELVRLAPPPRSSFPILSISPENFPPCVKMSLSMLENGENVPHYGRFLMATYLLAAGKSVDDIMALFPKAPDFKVSVTKYQVEHIAGIKGGKTRYRVPSCKTLQTHSFCFKDPIRCYEISSPLQYPSRKTRPESENKAKRTKSKNTVQGETRRGWTKIRR